MLIFISLLGVFLSILLWIHNAKNYPASRYLALFFFLISLYGINQYVLLYSGSVFWNSIVATHFTFLYYLIGPIFYFYIRSVVTDTVKLQAKDIFHFIPASIFFIALQPYYFSPYQFKLDVARQIVHNSAFLYTFKPTILSHIFSVKAVYLSRPLLIFIYTIYTFICYLKFVNIHPKEHRSEQMKLMNKWLILIFAFLLLFLTAHFSILYKAIDSKNSLVFYSLNFLDITSLLCFAGVIISPFLFPNILYGLPLIEKTIEDKISHIPMVEEVSLKEAPFVDYVDSDVQRRAFHMDEEYVVELEEKIRSCFVETEPYLNPDFNLNNLSGMLDVPVHHLAYYFREIKKQSFTDFRNEFRVNYSIELIKNNNHRRLTLEAIGQLSGFSSRYTFLRCFKKLTGSSPGEYAQYN